MRREARPVMVVDLCCRCGGNVRMGRLHGDAAKRRARDAFRESHKGAGHWLISREELAARRVGAVPADEGMEQGRLV